MISNAFFPLTILLLLLSLKGAVASDIVPEDEHPWNNGVVAADDMVPQENMQLAKNSAQLGFTVFLRLMAFEHLKMGNTNGVLYYFRLAAEDGDTLSRVQLGCMYYEGNGVLRNYGEAAKWFLLCQHDELIDINFPMVYFYIGVMHRDGLGMRQNRDQAIVWFDRGMEQGDENSAMAIMNMFESNAQDNQAGTGSDDESEPDNQVLHTKLYEADDMDEQDGLDIQIVLE
jgi:hypothetical protein